MSVPNQKSIEDKIETSSGITIADGSEVMTNEVRRKVLIAANQADLMSVIGTNRKERRRIAAVNNARTIRGSNKPFVKPLKAH